MTELILASASKARAEMLRNAGIKLETQPADVAEATIKCSLLARSIAMPEIAASLANAKSIQVSKQITNALVIGADQILIHDQTLFDKPTSMAVAKAHLRALRGETHKLVSAVSIAQDGVEIWSCTRSATLTMRNFSEAFLSEYLREFGDMALTSVGAYHLEGLGAQLFSRIEGDYFTVLGLPLLDVLEFLRMRGILKE